MSDTKVFCHCGAVAHQVPARAIKGYTHSPDRMWACTRYPQCDSYVVADADSGNPIGPLAGPKHRKAKKALYNLMASLWNGGAMQRHEVYGWMAMRMHGSVGATFRIAALNEDECNQAIAAVREYLTQNIDEGTALVGADWLEENGYGNCAASIRTMQKFVHDVLQLDVLQNHDVLQLDVLQKFAGPNSLRRLTAEYRKNMKPWGV